MMIVAAFAAPATANAADGYTNIAGVTQEGSSGGSGGSAPAEFVPVASTGSSSSSGTLPFTGMELGLVFAVGIGLLGAGLMLRRSRPRVQ